ncbi:MAG: LPS export ABC transporter periplasmic protein LptC [Acidobacteriaceae bacterium]
MRVTVERLRLWILIAASLLIAVLVGFFLWSGLQYRRIVQNLPRKLGVNIQQTASGFTYSQSSHGHTLFTIHASRLMSFKNDKAELHDVSITLYGPPGSHRADRIYGAEFEYDRKTGIASSQGKVEIDLESPSQAGPGRQQRPIHVQTSQLTYNSKTGLAQTSQYTEFSLPQGSGHATGASYNSKTGLFVLEQQVYLQTQPGKSTGPSATVIRAAHLSFQRDNNLATLSAPVIQNGRQTTSATRAQIYFRPDGFADHILAQGHVRMVSATGATITAQMAQIALSSSNQPQNAVLTGGVQYASHTRQETMQGSAQQARLSFAAVPGHSGRSWLRHAHFDQLVEFTEQIHGAPGDPKAVSTRQVSGGQADVAFALAADGAKSVPTTITVQQNAVATVRTSYTHQPPQQTTVRAGQLVATLADGRILRTVHATGHAEVSSLGRDGSINTTRSDSLVLTFAPQSRHAAAQLVSAVEDGHVVMQQTPAKAAHNAGGPVMAWASHAEYTEADQVLRLRGNPRIEETGALDLSADAIDYHRSTGEAFALGNVKATYRQASAASANGSLPQLGGKGATHVVAAHAWFSSAKGQATFYGASGHPARLWQGGNSVSAPVIELRRSPQQLFASGHGTDAVTAAFAAVMGSRAPAGLVRVASDSLTYSGKSHQADFRGHVEAVDTFGKMQASNINMQIAPAEDHQPTRLERMTATGGVTLIQPGRRAVGTRLVYTASDERYILTGRPGALPYLIDRVHGRTMGAALIFNNRNDSVEVNGGEGSAVTETSIPK